MIIFLIPLGALTVVALVAVFLLGFKLGGDPTQSELLRVRVEAAKAERRLHDLTRDAFVAMANAAERRRNES